MFRETLRKGGRKLLVASVGVAAVSYVGTNCIGTSVANLPAPPSCAVEPNNPYCVGMQPDAAVDRQPGPPDAFDASHPPDSSSDGTTG